MPTMILAAASCHVHHIFFACYHASHIQPEPCKVHKESPCPNPQLLVTSLQKHCPTCSALDSSITNSTSFADDVTNRRNNAVAKVAKLRELNFIGQRADVMEQRDERDKNRSKKELSEEKKKAQEEKERKKEEAKARRAAKKAWVEEQVRKLAEEGK